MRNTNQLKLSFISTAVALAIAGCGGNDGTSLTATGPETPSVTPPVVAPTESLQLSGTAAVGLALASSSVEVKCAAGTGTTTTSSNGSYTVSITAGKLPCLVKVTGTSGGAAVILHSVAEAGTSSGSNTTAVANVTPLTELIVAQLTGTAPATAFSLFTATTGVTTAQLTAAKTAVLTAIKDSTGVDLGSIDPLKAILVAATTTAPTQGNDYDKLLDALGQKISVASLPLVVNQITSNSGTTLTQALATAPGCPSAISGTYRALDFYGLIKNYKVDFKAMTINDGTHTGALAQNPNQYCEFSVGSTTYTEYSSLRFIVGPTGAGAYRSINSTQSTGYFFPVQSHGLSAFAGDWLTLQAGIDVSSTSAVPRMDVAKFSITGTGGFQACDYDTAAQWTGACKAAAAHTLVANADGGFDLREGSNTVARVFLFRAPSGAATLYGTTNPVGGLTQKTHFVGTTPAALPLPAVGATKTMTYVLRRTGSGDVPANTYVADLPTAGTATVLSVDSANGTFEREEAPSTVKINAPQPGLRLRGTTQANTRVQMPLPGLTVTFSVLPQATNQPYVHAITVTRP